MPNQDTWQLPTEPTSALHLDPLSVLYLCHGDPDFNLSKIEVSAHIHQKYASNPSAVSDLVQVRDSLT